MNSYFDSPVTEWINKNYSVDYLKLPELFDIFLNNLDVNPYKRTVMTSSVISYVHRCVPKKDVILLEEYYDICFKVKKLKNIHFYSGFVNTIIDLDQLNDGIYILKKNGIDLSKNHPHLRDYAFNEQLKNSTKLSEGYVGNPSQWMEKNNEILAKLKRYSPKTIDYKLILNQYLSYTTCYFLNENNIEISKESLCKLADKVYQYFIKNPDIRLVENSLDIYAQILSNSNVFQNTIAPTNNFQLAMYKFFDKKIPLPYNIEAENKLDEKLLINEFAFKFYNHPTYNYVHLNAKISQKINTKFSGKSFVNAETQELNLKKEIENKPTAKRNKI